MPGESQKVPESSADPSVLTTEALARGLASERDYVDGQIGILEERLGAMDRATQLLNETVNRVPTDLQQGIGNLERIMEEKFESVATQFKERDTRSERESRDNKVAVDAAFAAQKEAAAKEAEFNQRAIEKSEKGTSDRLDGVSEKVDDLKERFGGSEGLLAGQRQAVGDQQAGTASTGTLVGMIVGAAGLILALIATAVAVLR